MSKPKYIYLVFNIKSNPEESKDRVFGQTSSVEDKKNRLSSKRMLQCGKLESCGECDDHDYDQIIVVFFCIS